MTFERAEPNENYDVERWVSKGGHWELGKYRVMFGVRVRLGIKDGYGVMLDLCAGANRQLQDDVLRVVMAILLPVPDDADEGDIAELFPCRASKVKPLDLDRCWADMQQLAYETVLQLKKNEVQVL